MPGDLWKGIILFVVAAIFFVLLFALFTKVLYYFHSIPAFGDFLTKKLMLILFLTFFFFLIFSNLIVSLSTFFLSGEMSLVLSHPVPLSYVYYSRIFLILMESSWMVLILAIPIFLAYGWVFSAGIHFYIYAGICLIPFLIISSVTGSFITTIIVSALPAKKVRDFIFILSLIILGGLYVLFRIIQPEKLINPEAFKNIADYFTSLTVPNSYLLPSVWITEFLTPVLTGRGNGYFYFMMLISTAAAFLVIGEWVNGIIYPGAWTKAQEAREAKIGRGIIFALLTNPLKRIFAQQTGAVMVKDIKSFFRDATQWTQLILLAALIFVYLLNFRLIPFDRVPDISFFLKNIVSFMNLGLAGFVLSAIAVRFIYPAISLEGKKFWILKSSPISIKEYVRAKFFVNIIPFFFLGELLIILSNYLLGTTVFMMVLGIVTIFMLVFGIVSLGVGFGATFPKFHLDNPAKIATGFGGFMFMIVSLLYISLTVALESYPTYIIFFSEIGKVELGLSHWLLISVCFSGSLLLNLAVFYLPMRWGIRALEKREF